MNLTSLKAEFVRERRYLKNVTTKTLIWYESSFRAFQPELESVEFEEQLKPAIKLGIVRLLDERKISPVSVNVHLRFINAFFRWLKDEGHARQAIRVSLLKTEKKVLTILTDGQIRAIVQYHPMGRNDRRAHVLALLILDTGLRANEALNVQKTDIDFDNLLITVRKGKGQKQRIVPFSLQLRKVLFKYTAAHSHPQSTFVFTTRTGTVVSQRNALRDLKRVGEKIGVSGLRWHLLRHQFATNYLRSGGSVALLKKALGHASITTTMVYEHLATDDLSRVHHHHSVLATIR